MAQSTTRGNDPRSATTRESDGMIYPEESDFDIKKAQMEHLTRILDLQIESSRNIYDDALRLLLVNGLLIGAVIASGLILYAIGNVLITTSRGITGVVIAAGLLSLFASIAFATKAYLGDVANYGDLITTEDQDEYKDTYLSRNYSIVKENASALETRLSAIQNAISSFVAGLGGLALGVGFLLVPLPTSLQMAFFILAFGLIAYLVNNVMGMGYVETKTDKFVR